MRWIIAAAVLISVSAAQMQAQAQTPVQTPVQTPAQTQAPPPAPGVEQTHTGRHRTMVQRFDEANTTHDGHLTLEQARSKMPAVARDFAAIDTDHKGYVTVDEIRAHSRAARAARRAARKDTQ